MSACLVLILALIPAAFAESVEKKEAEAVADQMEMEMHMSAEASAMKSQLMASLAPHLANEESKKAQEQKTRETRWANILHKQQSALIEEEQKIKAEAKDLEKVKREKQWDAKIQAEKTLLESQECASKASVQALVVASQDQTYDQCLKSQLGNCAVSQIGEAVVVKECRESSAGWQKKCLADRAAENSDCAPAGADWAALRQGQKGEKADNSALQHLSDWCTFHMLLGMADENKADTPYALILNKKAAVSSDVMSKVADYAEGFANQEWDLVKVDGNTQSLLIRAENAAKIREAMVTMKAKPLDMLPQALMEVGVSVKDFAAGIQDACSTQAPQFH